MRIPRTYKLDTRLIARVRAAVRALRGRRIQGYDSEEVTQAGLIERGILAELLRLERKYNHGKAFRADPHVLAGGRPRKVSS